MTRQNKRDILKQYIGKEAFSYHGGYNEIINTKSVVIITEDNINKLINRSQCHVRLDLYNTKTLWQPA